MSDPTPPAGWYDDPLMANTRRYWDGTKWTDQLREVATPAPPPITEPAPDRRPAWWDSLWIRIPAGIVLILLAAAFIVRGTDFLSSIG